MLTPAAFIATDRLQALARGEDLPPTMKGAVLFADITGYTGLVEKVESLLGPIRGADVMTEQINRIFALLINEVYRYGGVVVGFGGDAILAWFKGDSGIQAIASGLAMQRAMQPFKRVTIVGKLPVSFTIKISIASGLARRFVVGDPEIQRLDVLAGDVLGRLAEVQRVAVNEHVVVAPDVAFQLDRQLDIARCFFDPKSEKQFVVVAGLNIDFVPPLPTDQTIIHTEIGQPWLLHTVYERLLSGQGMFAAEIRPVVVLFVRFTGIDYTLDEQAGAKLDGYISGVQRVLKNENGYLIKLTIDDKGSYLLVTFGAPLAHDDDTQRALKTAQALRELSSVFTFIQGTQIGVSRGRMLAGIFGSTLRAAYDLQGNQATIANRLMSMARPGQILVTKQVVESAKQHYDFAEPTSIQLKGIAEPMLVFELLTRRPPAPPTFTRRLVGRQSELQRLRHLSELARTHKGQVVRVEGAAGVGKSHLIASFLEVIKPENFAVVYGHCESTSRNVAYYPWRQILNALQHQTGQASSPGLLDELLELPIAQAASRLSDDPARHQEAIFVAFSKLIKECVHRQPLILVLEDVHWIDESSRKLTIAISRQLADLPVLLLVTQRPISPITDLTMAEWSALPHGHALIVTELLPDDIKHFLVEHLSANISTLAFSFLLATTQGNAFFLEEQIRTLKELDRLTYDQDKGEYTLATDLFQALQRANCLERIPQSGDWRVITHARLSAIDLGVPNTVEQSILARVDRLPEAHRLTLKVASVIGRTFTSALLAQAHPSHLDLGDFQRQMQTLQENDLVVHDPTTTTTTYAFRHQLTQEATYKTLPEADQRRLHHSVAVALEKLDPQAVEALAEHYWQGNVRDKSLIYLEKAAIKAQGNSANQTALNYYNRALTMEGREEWLKRKVEVLHALGQREEEQAILAQITHDGNRDSAELDQLWGQYYESIGSYDLAQMHTLQAGQSWHTQNEQVGEIRSLIYLGLIARRQGEYATARTMYEDAREKLQLQTSDTADMQLMLVRICNGLGAVYRQQDEFERAKQICQQVLKLGQTIENRSEEGEALNTLGVVAFYERDFHTSLLHHTQALELRRMIGDLAGEGISLYNMGLAICEIGDYDRAEQHWRDALAIQQTTQNRWEEANLFNVLGILYYQLGDFAQAQATMNLGLQLSREIGDKAGEAYVQCNIGQVLRDCGKLHAAARRLRQSLGLAKTQKDHNLAAMNLSHLALTSLYLKEYSNAIRLARQAIDLRERIGMRELTTLDQTTTAVALWQTGRRNKAIQMVSAVFDQLNHCKGIGPEFPHWDYFRCAQIWQVHGNIEQARLALDKAYEFLMTRADKISDENKRNSFLSNVRLNRQIIQMHNAPGSVTRIFL